MLPTTFLGDTFDDEQPDYDYYDFDDDVDDPNH